MRLGSGDLIPPETSSPGRLEARWLFFATLDQVVPHIRVWLLEKVLPIYEPGHWNAFNEALLGEVLPGSSALIEVLTKSWRSPGEVARPSPRGPRGSTLGAA